MQHDYNKKHTQIGLLFTVRLLQLTVMVAFYLRLLAVMSN